jgi:signal transduction histidine kinase
VGTSDGLNLFDKKNKSFRQFKHDARNAGSISSNYIRSIYEDSNGIVWVGTSEGGLNRLDVQKGIFTVYRQKDGLPADGIYGILGDRHNNVWISTNRGLAKYNSSEKKFTIYDEGDGLLGNEYSVGGYHQGSSGKLYFGTFKGLNIFDPDSIQDNSFAPPVVISDIKIANTSRPQLLGQPVINLDYSDNTISFEFAALSFEETEQNQYAYQLSGVDADWVYSGTRRFVSYTNLEGGNYTFRIKAANSDGIWNQEGVSMKIHVEPPVWKERWFNAAIVLLIGLLAFVMYKIRIRSIQIQNRKLEELIKKRTEELRQRSIQLEQSLTETKRQKQEADQQRQLAEEANRIKTELTSITVHDLKNPLGGILMYTDLVKESANDPAKVTRLINTIRETTQNMFHLVSNLLKRTKLESSYISLQKDLIDIALLVRVATERNQLQVSHKNQQLHLETEPGCYASVDVELINDLIENLLSNAIKFTPYHGNIWIWVKSADENILLIVKDEGPGFRQNEIAKLFRPFQRLSAKPTGGESSTGLGLSIVHQIVQLHGGQIQVACQEQGRGSTFTVILPGIRLSERQEATVMPASRSLIN